MFVNKFRHVSKRGFLNLGHKEGRFNTDFNEHQTAMSTPYVEEKKLYEYEAPLLLTTRNSKLVIEDLIIEEPVFSCYTRVTPLLHTATAIEGILCRAWWLSGRASRLFGREDWGSKPSVVERRTFRSKGLGFKTWAISFTPLCKCLSEEALKDVDTFYVVWCLLTFYFIFNF